MNLPNVWTKYRGTLKMRDKLFGGVPRNLEQLEGWLKSKGQIDKLDEVKEEVDLVEETEKHWCGFRGHNKPSGIYIRGAMIKQMIKVCARRLQLYKIPKYNRKGISDVLHGAMFVKPERIHLGKDRPDGFQEFQGKVNGRRGPVSILSRFDYIEDIQPFEFELWIIEACPLTEEDLLKCFALGQESGLGAMRPQDYGKFDLLEFVKLNGS